MDTSSQRQLVAPDVLLENILTTECVLPVLPIALNVPMPPLAQHVLAHLLFSKAVVYLHALLEPTLMLENVRLVTLLV